MRHPGDAQVQGSLEEHRRALRQRCHEGESGYAIFTEAGPQAPRGEIKMRSKMGAIATGVIVERKSVRSITKRLLATISAITKMAEELRKTKKKGGEYAFNNDQEKLEDES